MALVWNGQDWDRIGSDTESDTDAPLTEGDQIVAILNSRERAPPLPSLEKHAKATAKAVIEHTLATPAVRRTRAQDFALALSRSAPDAGAWVEAQLRAHRKEHTIKAAITLALYPSRSATWACKETGRRVGHQHIIQGLAMNLRMHPFARAEVEAARGTLASYEPPRPKRAEKVAQTNISFTGV